MSHDGPTLRVEVAYALPERAWRLHVSVPAGSSVEDALQAADMPAHVQGLVVDPERLAIHGRLVGPGDRVHDGDRIEILRPLRVDPKQARRDRAARTAGNQ
jgi:putative ubiquitin-RnfH superfamily antitoxin RatB of RatAB toxin-antitoxin module